MLASCLKCSRAIVFSIQYVGCVAEHATVSADTEIREVVRAVPAVLLVSVWAGPWQQCSSNCGGGWQERALLCSSAPGYLAEAWQCYGSGIMSTLAAMPCRCSFFAPLLTSYHARQGGR